MKIAFTVCNRYHLRHALALAHSLKKYNPDRHFFWGWVDRMKLPDLPDWITLIPAESLEIADWADMESRYHDFELVAACKPFFARHILAAFPNCEELLFLSPTTLLFDSIDQVVENSAFLQLSPQRLRPVAATENYPAALLDDKRILNTGMYKAGSWIMHPDGQERALLDWWCDRMNDRGFFNLCEGMCLDQLWLNYLPIYHERVETVRNPGWQYGLHAIPGSRLTRTDGKYFVDDSPLISLDFAGLESHHPVWSDHTDLAKKQPLWNDLRKFYRALLQTYNVQAEVGEPTYGQITPISSNRAFRKKAVRFLNKVVARIESFDWTYN